MGVYSRATLKDLLEATSFGAFLEKNRDHMLTQTLSEHLMMLLAQKKLKRSDVVRDSGLERTYIYQIFNGEKKPSRDKLIAIAFGLHLSVEETQRMLKLGGCSELYPRVARDAVILFAINREQGIREADRLLYDNDFPTLHEQDK